MGAYDESIEGCEEMPSIKTPDKEVANDINDEEKSQIGFPKFRDVLFCDVDPYHYANIFKEIDSLIFELRSFQIPHHDRQKKQTHPPEKSEVFVTLVDADYEVVEEITCSTPSSKEKKHNKAIYLVHSDGHVIVISKYSKGSNDVVTYRASTKLLCDIICKKKQPVIIHLEKLSNLQLSEVRKALDTISSQITVKQVCKHEKSVWVVNIRDRKLSP